MGAIIAYLGSATVPDPQKSLNRRAGQTALGQRLIANMAKASRKKLRETLSDFVNTPTTSTTKTYDLRYEYMERLPGGPVERAYRIKSAVVDDDDDGLIKCALYDDGGVKVGYLRLKFSKDKSGKDADNVGDHEMNVVFPSNLDSGGFGYLDAISTDLNVIDDVGATHPNLTAQKHYLAAFKFLTRCK